MSNEVERLRAELALAVAERDRAYVERDRAVLNLIQCRDQCRRLATTLQGVVQETHELIVNTTDVVAKSARPVEAPQGEAMRSPLTETEPVTNS